MFFVLLLSGVDAAVVRAVVRVVDAPLSTRLERGNAVNGSQGVLLLPDFIVIFIVLILRIN